MPNVNRVTLGLTGGMCSGKNTFGDYMLDAYGERFGGGAVVSSSDAARQHIADNDLGLPTRDLTREVATMLRRERSETFLVDWALNQFEADQGMRIVAGLYIPAECNRIREVGGLVVAIHAADDERQKRMSGRSRSGEHVATEFSRLDNEDMNATSTDQRLSVAMTMADVEIYDPGTEGDYISVYSQKADQIMSMIAGRK